MGPPAQLLFLLLLLQSQEGNAVSQSSSTPLIVNGVLGESVTLHLKFPAEETVEAIIWLYNGKSIAFIKARGAGSPLIHVTDEKRRERMNFTRSYSLQLSNLTMADTGSYGAQITTETFTFLFTYILRIFMRLPKPQVRVDSIISENRTCSATLRCSVEEGGETIVYKWTPMGPGAVVSEEGSVLRDSWSLYDLDQTYTFTALNPVSSVNATLILAAQLCAGSKEAESTYCPVKWIFLGKGIFLLVLLGILGTWHIQTQVLSNSLGLTQGYKRPPVPQKSQAMTRNSSPATQGYLVARKGRILNRVFELKGELQALFQENKRLDFAECFGDVEWLQTLASLAHTFDPTSQLDKSFCKALKKMYELK
ncbi:PREDICTED: SLAM family member 6-like [Galeopterus variegatus]|uniref:SLAM family member 6-like n=1 Tax=Galeopterus variegatus TaxID=482537 RepID=A0ABM0SAY9_GALVR|nr:PREDICTED: SLAM family member 6-like [Galeopterus variegatus]